MKMKCLCIATAVFGLALAHAETATNIVNGVTVNYSDTYYYVGDTGPFNVLIITNAGRLNCMPGGVSYIGKGESSDNNSALVTGPGSYWRTGYLNLGLFGSGNSLTISNGGVVDATGTYVGYESNAFNNAITVTGTGSTLNTGNQFMFGEKGLNSTLTIANGGRVNVDDWACLGKDLLLNSSGNAMANNAVALVTGNGSVFSISNAFYIGLNGIGNQLTIADGGEVRDTTGYLGRASDSDNQNNRGIVTGANSKWINSGWLVVGDTTSGNHLTVTNGGLVVNVDASLGNSADPDANSADNNTVLVAGSGSVWSNSGSLYVGRMGDGNSVTISNSGAVFVAGNAYISADILAANNQINLAGGSLILTNAGAGTLEVRNGSFDFNGGTLLANQLLLTNNTTNGNNAFFNFNHGTFTNTGGSQIIAPAGSDIVIGNTAGQTATWVMLGGTNSIQPVVSNAASIVLGGTAGAMGNVVVSGAATVWSIDGTLDVRRGSVTLDGGVLDVGLLLATNNTASATNALLAFHSGTLNSHGMRIVVPAGQNFNVGDVAGQTATWNLLDGTNGIFAVPGKSAGIYLGSVAGALANVLVTGSGTVWSNGADLVVGQASTGNQLTITNGAQAFNNLGIIGNQSSASNNSALVTGSGSVWNSSSPLVIGNSGVGNSLTIANTGRVVSGSGFIGHDTGVSNNTVLVTGSGSVWTNTSDLTVGNDGSGNSLTIINGGSVGVAGNSYIGYSYVAYDNTATIAGSGSVWNTKGYLAVGYAGFGNQLTLANGGAALVRDAYVGITSSASNNTVLVTDSGSLWNVATNLYMGYGGAGNTLTVTNGGALSVGVDTFIGYNASANNNSVLVAGGGSVWNVATNLYMGYGGAGNTLLLTNGGALNVGVDAFIGYNASASNNAVLVTGNGSTWASTRYIYIGSNGVGNAVNVLGGGSVGSAAGYLGYESGASNNTLLVAHSGTVWSNRLDLTIGYNGSGNSLIISNQGTVIDNRGFIGAYASSSNNSVLVTGAGSVWSNASDIRMGMNGSANTLTITNRGTVISSGGGIGQSASASSNSVLVTGSGSVWTNSGDFSVGGVGVGNQLTIAEGGAMYDRRGTIGGNATANGNTVQVTGPNSAWYNSSYLNIGNLGSGNRLAISNGGLVTADSVSLGNTAGSSNNTLAISGGSLLITDATYGQLDLRRGVVTMDSGTLWARSILLTNGAMGTLTMSGGTLAVNAITNDGSANLVLSGGTLQPLSANGNWSAALVVSNAVTLNTTDAGGQARTNVLSGNLSGGGTLNVTGLGKLSLNGSDLGGGWIHVQDGATLGGTGALAHVQIGSNVTLAAGNSIGTFIASNLTLAGGAHIQLEINATNGVAGVDWDLITVHGPAALSGLSSSSPLTVDVVNFGGLNGTAGPSNTVSWTFLDTTGGISGYDPNAFAFTSTGLDGWTNGAWSVAQTGNSLLLTYTAIPEPVSVALVFLLGGALVGWRRLRRWGT